MRILLLHIPLVGPSTWRGVAEAMAAAGHDPIVPDLRDAVATGHPRGVVDVALDAAGRTCDVVAGHSGAGFFVPFAAAQVRSPTGRMIFVDAGLPPCDGEATASADYLEQLRLLAVDGVLPKWSTWWPVGTMELLIPDPRVRAPVESELIDVPLPLFESSMELPRGWCEAPCSYLLLSDGYRGDAGTAHVHRWPVIEHIGGHLDIVNEPRLISDELIKLANLGI